MVDTERKTLDQFIGENRITIKNEWTDKNPSFDDSPMDHWRSTLRMGGRRLTIIFSMGHGHGGKEPNANDILQCLALDAAGFENARDFEDWCNEYGYDDDSRKAERIYEQVRKQARKLKTFLGDEKYEELLWEVDSD
jgi:hypothetical protein